MSPHRLLVASVLGLVALTACGSDDDAADEPADAGVTSAYTQAIMDSTSHDEILLPGGDMVVAVACLPDQSSAAIVTAVAVGLEEGLYSGSFEPSSGVDLTLQVSGPGEAVAAAQMTLDADGYVVTFEGIEGAEFEVRGC